MGKKLSIETFQKIARDRGGKLITDVYTNCGTLMEWECGNKHRWWTNGNRIKHRGDWCPYCSGQAKLHIEDLKQLAVKRGRKTNITRVCKR